MKNKSYIKRNIVPSSELKHFKVPFGAWDIRTGDWEPNRYLEMSEEDQHKYNVMNGFSCGLCYKMKSRCSCITGKSQ